MLLHTMVNTRQNVADSWYVLSQAVVDHRNTAYIVPGKIMSRDEEEQQAGNQLTRTIITTFATFADYTEYINDPIIQSMISLRNTYNSLYNIQSVVEIQEI